MAVGSNRVRNFCRPKTKRDENLQRAKQHFSTNVLDVFSWPTCWRDTALPASSRRATHLHQRRGPGALDLVCLWLRIRRGPCRSGSAHAWKLTGTTAQTRPHANRKRVRKKEQHLSTRLWRCWGFRHRARLMYWKNCGTCGSSFWPFNDCRVLRNVPPNFVLHTWRSWLWRAVVLVLCRVCGGLC